MSGVGDSGGRLSSRDGRRGTSSRGLQQRRREARDLQQGRLLQVDGAARHAAAVGQGRADAQGRRRGLGLAALDLLAGWRGRRSYGWCRRSGVGDGGGRLSSRDGRRRTSSRGLQQRRREARDLKQGRLLQVDGIARHAAAAARRRADAQGPGRGGGAAPGRRGGAAAGRCCAPRSGGGAGPDWRTGAAAGRGVRRGGGERVSERVRETRERERQ